MTDDELLEALSGDDVPSEAILAEWQQRVTTPTTDSDSDTLKALRKLWTDVHNDVIPFHSDVNDNDPLEGFVVVSDEPNLAYDDIEDTYDDSDLDPLTDFNTVSADTFMPIQQPIKDDYESLQENIPPTDWDLFGDMPEDMLQERRSEIQQFFEMFLDEFELARVFPNCSLKHSLLYAEMIALRAQWEAARSSARAGNPLMFATFVEVVAGLGRDVITNPVFEDVRVCLAAGKHTTVPTTVTVEPATPFSNEDVDIN